MKPVKIVLKHSNKINYIHCSSGEPGIIITTNSKLSVGTGRIYKIPVDTMESLDDFNVFKPIGRLNELIDIRNIKDGFAVIFPIVNNVILKDEQELGSFI